MLPVVVVVVLAGGELSAATEPFSTIAKRGVAATKLDQAIAKLPLSPSESPKFWSRIANDSTYSRYHRRRAVFQLFRRHIHAGMRLNDLAHLLNRPTWLRAGDIDVIDILAGELPVSFGPRDVVFVLRVLPEPRQDTSAVYLRIAGRVDIEGYRSCILGTAKGHPIIGQAVIAEIGFCDYSGDRPSETGG
jgi:hypothetical protein